MADDGAQQYGKKGRKLDGRMIGAIIVLVILAAFILQNREKVQLSLLVFDFSMPLWIALAGTLLISLAVGFMLGRGRYKS